MEKQDNFKNEFLRTFNILSYSHNKWDVWNDFIYMAAASFSNAVDKQNFEKRENEYLRIIKKYNKNEQQLFPKLLAKVTMALDANPNQDFLGSLFMDMNLGNDRAGQFFTPYSVCRLMSGIAVGNIVEQVQKDHYITVNDCCCGAGATLIAAINEAKEQLEKAGMNYQNHVFVVAQDIDRTVALMCYIQLSLLGVAGFVKVGDSLYNPPETKDTYENHWFTPIYFTELWQMRNLIKKLGEISS